MREALELVKRELGPDAVILGTRHASAEGFGARLRRARVEVTAAPPGLASPAPRVGGATPAAGGVGGKSAERPAAGAAGGLSASVDTSNASLSPADLAAGALPPVPRPLYPLYVRLVENEVAEELAAQLTRQAAARLSPTTGEDAATLQEALRQYIAELLPHAGGVQLTEGTPRRVALIGPPGAGKTTTLAKLAAHFKLRQRKRVAVLSLDTHRLAAHEQLRRYADILEVPLHTAQTLSEVKQCLKVAAEVDVLLIDTIGVGLRDQARFARLASLLRAARPDELHLVLPASLAPDVQVRIARSFAPLGPSRVVLTRLDDAIGFGVILNVARRLDLPPSYLTTGQNVPHDLEEACGPRLAALICPAD